MTDSTASTPLPVDLLGYLGSRRQLVPVGALKLSIDHLGRKVLVAQIDLIPSDGQLVMPLVDLVACLGEALRTRGVAEHLPELTAEDKALIEGVAGHA